MKFSCFQSAVVGWEQWLGVRFGDSDASRRRSQCIHGALLSRMRHQVPRPDRQVLLRMWNQARQHSMMQKKFLSNFTLPEMNDTSVFWILCFFLCWLWLPFRFSCDLRMVLSSLITVFPDLHSGCQTTKFTALPLRHFHGCLFIYLFKIAATSHWVLLFQEQKDCMLSNVKRLKE